MYEIPSAFLIVRDYGAALVRRTSPDIQLRGVRFFGKEIGPHVFFRDPDDTRLEQIYLDVSTGLSLS